MRFSRASGLTLVEVLVAMVIIAVAVLALAQLQVTSLRNTSIASSIAQTTRLVRGELEWQRQTAVEPVNESCQLELLPAGFVSCEVAIEPCAYLFTEAGGGRLECGEFVSPSTWRITVNAVGPRGQEMSLSTLYTGSFVSGAAGSVPNEILTGEE